MMSVVENQQHNQLDIFCRVESGIITETYIPFEENGQRKFRPITEQDIVDRGHPYDWYVRVSKINSVTPPKHYRKKVRFCLVRLPDLTVTVEMDESLKPPSISEILADLKKEGVVKWAEIPEYSQKLLVNVVTSIMTSSITKLCETGGYYSIDSATRMIGCHIPKYDAEGRRVQYLYAETWAKFEWYMDQLKADLVPFPTHATDILQHFPRLTWSDTDTEAAVSDPEASGDTDTTDTPSV